MTKIGTFWARARIDVTFAHISDTHLGQKQYGAREREEDMYGAFSQAVDISIRDHVEFALISGDLFDMAGRGRRAVVEFAKQAKRLADAGIPAYYVLGEHDTARIGATPLDFARNYMAPAIHAGDRRPIEVGGTLILGFDMFAPDELNMARISLEEAGAIAKAHQGKSVLLMHQGITEATGVPGELETSALPGSFSYYAMGHLHDRHEARPDGLGGPLAYPGSTEVAIHEGINGHEKGFYEVDLSGEGASLSWIGLDTRPHMLFCADYADLGSRAAEIASAASACKKKPVVGISLSGKFDAAEARRIAAPVRDASVWCQITSAGRP